MPRMADVANTWPFEPNVNTTIDATTTIKSEKKVYWLKMHLVILITTKTRLSSNHILIKVCSLCLSILYIKSGSFCEHFRFFVNFYLSRSNNT